MYRKQRSGWMAQLDFKLLSVAVMLIMYFTALIPRDPFALRPYLSGALTLILTGMLFSITTDFYRNVLYRDGFRELLRSAVYMGVCEGVALLQLIVFEKKALDTPSIALFMLCSIFTDFLVKGFHKWLIKQGLSTYNSKVGLVIISTDKYIEETLEHLKNHSFGQYTVDGIVMLDSKKYRAGDEIGGYPVLCEVDELPTFVQRMWIDEVFVNLPDRRLSPELIKQITDMGIAMHRVIDFNLDPHERKMVEQIAGYTCLTESVRIIQTSHYLAKRLIDIIGGLVGSLMTIVLTIILGPLIFFSDPGPIFFKQKRVGKGGRVFTMLKFRSMYKDAEERKAGLMSKNNIPDGKMFKIDNDPRVLGSGPDGTRMGIGRFIRKYSLDEFPQFFMVLKGDMSLVGTRPPTLDEWEKYGRSQRARMAIRPGLTGMWQASGRSDITDFDKVVELDMYYITHMSILLDLKLIIKTIKNILTGSGAK